VDAIDVVPTTLSLRGGRSRSRSLSRATSMDRAVSSIFVLGGTPGRVSDEITRTSKPNSLSSMSYEELGGVEYGALRVLLKIVIGRSTEFI
jgi:hypothetical protein